MLVLGLDVKLVGYAVLVTGSHVFLDASDIWGPLTHWTRMEAFCPGPMARELG